LPLVASNYLVVVTDRHRVGTLFGKHDVFVVKKAEIIPIASESMLENMNETQVSSFTKHPLFISPEVKRRCTIHLYDLHIFK
jgi:hypothetical protein